MFTTILYGFGMILLELTRTDACFQQNYRGVIFCAKIKVLGMGWKFTVIFYAPKENPEAQELDQKLHEEAARVEGAHPLGSAPWLAAASLSVSKLADLG